MQKHTNQNNKEQNWHLKTIFINLFDGDNINVHSRYESIYCDELMKMRKDTSPLTNDKTKDNDDDQIVCVYV